MGCVFICTHQPTIASNVSIKDCGKSSWQTLFHWVLLLEEILAFVSDFTSNVTAQGPACFDPRNSGYLDLVFDRSRRSAWGRKRKEMLRCSTIGTYVRYTRDSGQRQLRHLSFHNSLNGPGPAADFLGDLQYPLPLLPSL